MAYNGKTQKYSPSPNAPTTFEMQISQMSRVKASNGSLPSRFLYRTVSDNCVCLPFLVFSEKIVLSGFYLFADRISVKPTRTPCLAEPSALLSRLVWKNWLTLSKLRFRPSLPFRELAVNLPSLRFAG